MKQYFLLFMIFLGGCARDAGPIPDVPPAVISGAETPVPIGEIATVSVSPTVFPPSIINVYYDWKVLGEKDEVKKMWVSEDRTSVSFGTGAIPSKIRVILASTYSYGTSSKVLTDVKSPGIAVAQVQVGDPSPPTPPVPPTPPPAPVVIPDGQFKLAKKVYDSLVSTKSANKPFLSAISASYKTVAQQTRAGVITKLSDAMAALKKSNQSSFDQNKEKMSDWTMTESVITESIYDLYTNKKLPTLTEYATAWAEIANGFDAYISTLK